MVKAPPDAAISSFPQVLSIDTCSVWNLLRSKKLTSATINRGLHFLLSDYVRYECLAKKRKSKSKIENDLKKSLEEAISDKKTFSVRQIDIADLSSLAKSMSETQRFGKGEIAAIALAQKMRSGFMTDDRAARKLASSTIGTERTRTTSHLVGWLVFSDKIIDGDVSIIIDDNKKFRGASGHIGLYIKECYNHAMMLKLKHRVG